MYIGTGLKVGRAATDTGVRMKVRVRVRVRVKG